MQIWLTLIGIGLDFLGFCILLREWWIAMFSERSELAIEQRLDEQERTDRMTMQQATGTMRESMERSARSRADHLVGEARRARRKTLKSRRSLFLLSTLLIITGTGLQFAGAVPSNWIEVMQGLISEMN